MDEEKIQYFLDYLWDQGQLRDQAKNPYGLAALYATTGSYCGIFSRTNLYK